MPARFLLLIWAVVIGLRPGTSLPTCAALSESDATTRSPEAPGALELCPGRIVPYEVRIGRGKCRLRPLLALRLVELDRRQLER